jgi:hypothetical protein
MTGQRGRRKSEGDVRYVMKEACAYRKSSPSILVKQSTQDRTAQILEQGCAGFSPGSANRCDQFTRHPGWTSSPLRPRLSCRYKQEDTLCRLAAPWRSHVQPTERRWSWWGRVIFYVADVDAVHQHALAAGYRPTTTPRDAEWGERFFHMDDPDGHELSFARPFLSSTSDGPS